MRSLVIRSALLVAAFSVASAVDLVAIPEVLPDANGITTATLTVDAARIAVGDTFSLTTRAYYYNGVARLHGPTLVVRAGGRLNLTLVNNLADDSALDATKSVNTFRHANTTNIHTHGLHVDPAIDSIFRLASPGGGVLTYDLPIPESHAPGMFWYHSHTHGAATMHIMGGLVGGMTVEALPRDNVPTAISSLTSHYLVMQLLNFQAETNGDGVTTHTCDPAVAGYNPFKTYSFAELEAESGSLLYSSPTFNSAVTDRTFYTINGQYQPTVTVAPNESRLYKLVYAAGSKSPALIFPSTCVVQNIAFDGVYFDAPRNVTYLQLIVASRVEFVMTCATAGTHAVNVVINGNTDNVRTTGGGPLFFVVATGTTRTATELGPSSLSGITKPTYLADMRSLATVDTTNQVSLDQGGHEVCKFQLGVGTDCSFVGGPARTTCTRAAFSGSRGTTNTAAYEFTMRVGQTTQWALIGRGNTPHPLHIHVNHFQITGYSGSTTVLNHWMQIGDWRDTIPVLDGTLTIRFVAHELPGETVMHCHELNHEDKGLMGTFLIQPALTSGTTTTTTSAASATTTTTSAASSAVTTTTAAAGSSGTTTTTPAPPPSTSAGTTATTATTAAPGLITTPSVGSPAAMPTTASLAAVAAALLSLFCF